MSELPKFGKEKHKDYEHRIAADSGLNLDVSSQGGTTGAWLSLGKADANMSVVSETLGGHTRNMIQYYDGSILAGFPRFALGIDDGEVFAQFVFFGEGFIGDRLRTITLKKLMELVEQAPLDPS